MHMLESLGWCGKPRFSRRDFQVKTRVEYKMLEQDDPPPRQLKNRYFYSYHAFMLMQTVFLRFAYVFYWERFLVYLLPLAFGTGAVCAHWRGRSNLTWFYAFTIMAIQNIYDLLDLGLPAAFVLYAAIPMVMGSVLENAFLALVNDSNVAKYIDLVDSRRRGRRESSPPSSSSSSDNEEGPAEGAGEENQVPPWLTRFIVNLFKDEDVQSLYPLYFELYMTACCAILCVKGGGFFHVKCLGQIYMALLWILFAYTEEVKLRRRPKHLKLPSPVVKVVYLLYAPVPFWIAISVLICMNLAMINGVTRRMQLVFASLVLANAILAIVFRERLDTCPWPHV